MKSIATRLFSLLIILAALGMAAGCDEESPAQGYVGTWKGKTSNGGTVYFLIEENLVMELHVRDPQAHLWIEQPVHVMGHGFNLDPEIYSTEDSQVTFECNFSSKTEESGSYALRQGRRVLAGTYTAYLQQQ